MKQNFYLFLNGKLRRKDNSLCYVEGETDLDKLDQSQYPIQNEISVKPNGSTNETEKSKEEIYIPIESVDTIFCFSETQFSRAVLSFLGKEYIPVFIYDFYGNYCGTYYPKGEVASGERLVKQVKHHLDPLLRLNIAKEFVTASIKNMDSTLAYYDNMGIILVAERGQIQNMYEDALQATGIKRLMGAEGFARKNYYLGWKKILSPREFEGRSSNPPGDSINAVISFLYSLLYNVCSNECYRVGLHPGISYVHEVGDNRNSLAFDIADIFKSIMCDRIIFELFNSNVVDDKNHFRQENGGWYLNKEGMKLVTKKFDEKLKSTFHHRELNRSISYRQLIQHECYKLLAHLNGEKHLKCFHAWW